MTIKINDPGSPYAQTQNLEPGFNMELELELFNSSTHEHHLDHSKLQGLHLPDQHPIGAILDLGPRLDEQDERTGILEQDTTTLLQRADEAQARLNAVEPKVSALETTVAEEQEKVEWLQGESSYYYDELLSHNDRLRDLEWNAGLDKPILDGAVADIAAVKDRVAAVEPKVSNLEIQMAAEMPKTAALQYDAQVEKNKVVALQSDVASAKANIAMIQSDNQAEKAKVIALQGDATTEKLKVTNLQAETNSLDYRLDVAEPKITALQTEVGNARVDSKGVTQANLDARIDTDMALKADRVFATNLVTNGDFSNGTSGWAADYSDLSATSGAIRLTHNSVTTTVRIKQLGLLNLTSKYYVSFKARTSYYADVQWVRMRYFTSMMSLPDANWKRYSAIEYSTNTAFSVEANFTALTQGTSYVEFDDVIAIDLTAAFGAGNEPTLAEMDLLMSAYPNSWFGGTKELLPLTRLGNLLYRKTDKVWATNLLANGDFSKNLDSWYTNGVLVTGTVQHDLTSAMTLYQIIPVVAGHKYYVSLDARTSIADTIFELKLYSATIPAEISRRMSIKSTTSMTRYSDVLLATASDSSGRLHFNRNTMSGMSYVDNIILIDLTAAFGAGNEPTAQEMDLLMSAYSSSWFDGTKEILPLAMVESWVSRKADKVLATNLINNGDFSNGSSGWNLNAENSYVSNGVLNNDLTSSLNVHHFFANEIAASQKLYLALTGSVDYANNGVVFNLLTQSGTLVSNNLTLQFTATPSRYSGMFTTTASGAKRISLSRYGTSGVAALDNIVLINLTVAFGAGNEPTLDEMDLLMSKFPNSWFNGSEYLYNLADTTKLIARKADATQEAWITPTLLNGATHGTPSVQFMKDTLGFVHLKGRLGVGTSSGVQFTLPSGYRPNVTTYFATPRISNATSIGRCDIQVGGSVVLYETNGTFLDLSSVIFKAEV